MGCAVVKWRCTVTDYLRDGELPEAFANVHFHQQDGTFTKVRMHARACAHACLRPSRTAAFVSLANTSGKVGDR